MRRVVTIDVGEGLIEMINPQIISQEGSQVGPEGCLSIPGRRCTVERPMKVKVRAQGRDGGGSGEKTGKKLGKRGKQPDLHQGL